MKWGTQIHALSSPPLCSPFSCSWLPCTLYWLTFLVIFIVRELLEQEDLNEFERLPMEEKLVKVLGYLRKQYFYCYYCGCQYGGSEELSKQCPGLHEDDHENEQLC
jgi:hypothetical protein